MIIPEVELHLFDSIDDQDYPDAERDRNEILDYMFLFLLYVIHVLSFPDLLRLVHRER